MLLAVKSKKGGIMKKNYNSPDFKIKIYVDVIMASETINNGDTLVKDDEIFDLN